MLVEQDSHTKHVPLARQIEPQVGQRGASPNCGSATASTGLLLPLEVVALSGEVGVKSASCSPSRKRYCIQRPI